MGFKRGNEPSGFIKFQDFFFVYVRKCKPFKKDVAISCKCVQKTVVL